MENDLQSIQNDLDLLSDKLTTRARSKENFETCHLKNLEAERKPLIQILRKEKADVNKLYAMSVNMLFRHFLKNTELQLEIEHQEYVVATLRYNEFINAFNLPDYELSDIESLILDPMNHNTITL